MRVIIATAKRNLIITQRSFPLSMIISRIISGVYIVLFSYFTYYYLFSGSIDERFVSVTGSSDYFTYVILGAVTYTFSLAILMGIGGTLISEVREGTYESMLLAPHSRIGYFVGCMTEQIFRSLIELVSVLIIGALLGARYSNINISNLILLWILSLVVLFSMGIFMSSLMLLTRDTYICQNTMAILILVLCGVSFPVSYLPQWAQIISRSIPLTTILDLFRESIMSNYSITNDLTIIAKIVIISAIYFVVGLVIISISEKKYIEWISSI